MDDRDGTTKEEQKEISIAWGQLSMVRFLLKKMAEFTLEERTWCVPPSGLKEIQSILQQATDTFSKMAAKYPHADVVRMDWNIEIVDKDDLPNVMKNFKGEVVATTEGLGISEIVKDIEKGGLGKKPYRDMSNPDTQLN